MRSSPVYEDVIADKLVAVRIDVSDETEAQIAFKQRYGITSVPYLVIVRPDGSVVTRVKEILEPDSLAQVLARATDDLGARAAP